MNRSAPPGPIVPSLFYEDVPAAVVWLRDAFGFEARTRWGPPDQRTVLLAVGEGAVFVRGRTVGHGSASSLALGPPDGERRSCSLSVRVGDVDAHHEAAVAHGAEILLEPTSYPFGERQYSALDLAGHLWTFTQTVADVAPDAWGAEPA